MTRHSRDRRHPAMRFVARALWRVPFRFGLVRLLGPRYSLRCVVFHDISDEESPFTRGLGVTIPRATFEAALRFLVKHYTPVRLQDVLADPGGRTLPPRPVLVTFDDAYASVAHAAAPLCGDLGVPAACFVNAAFLDNGQLALDNLICYATNRLGLAAVTRVAREITETKELEVRTLSEVFSSVLPRLSLRDRGIFRGALLELVATGEADLAKQAGLYMTSDQLRRLAASGWELGNHTYTHVHCRTLTDEAMCQEIDRNQADLAAISGRPVQSFSVPYGSAADLTGEVMGQLRGSGHDAIFLSESVANRHDAKASRLDRVSIHGGTDEALFAELEIFPRLRAVRNGFFRGRDSGRENVR